MIKKSGKKEKVVYENINGEKIVLEGSSEKDIVSYKESDPSVKRQIIPLKAPAHKGFDMGKSKSTTKSTKETSRAVTMRMGRARTKKSRTKSRRTKKSKKY
jgi:hypothetical protein